MKIISIQQFSLYSVGGGSRILRRLYERNENNVVSLSVVPSINVMKGPIKEEEILSYPVHKNWMRSYIRKFTIWLRYKVLYSLTLNRLLGCVSRYGDYEVVHLVDQWNFHPQFIEKLTANFQKKKKVWVSFHDHFISTGGNEATTKHLWSVADRRLVISEELGKEYQKLFGNKSYEIITDGLYESEISDSATLRNATLVIYFAGLLHIAYYPLFECLANALDILQKRGYSFKLILRGTQVLSFLNARNFDTEYRPSTLDDVELKFELNNADILYLPIKFSDPFFYKYSLSTKMVGYLGATGNILYHGHCESAANHLLSCYNAASVCYSLQVDDMMEAIVKIYDSKANYSIEAKTLAKEKFILSKIQKAFWLDSN